MANKITLLILIVALGVGCGESHRSMNNRFSDSVIKYWSLEKCSWECNKKDSMDYYSKRGNLYNDSLKYVWSIDFPNEKQKSRNIPQTKCPCDEDWSKWSSVSGTLPIAKDAGGLTSSTSNDSLVYVGEDAAKTGNFEPDNPLPWAMDMVATDKNGKTVEVVHGYEYSIINYKTVPEKGVFIDTTIWDDGFGYKNYFINILKDRRLIAEIKFDIHDCAQLKGYEVLVDKKYIDKLKSGVVRYGTNPNNPKPFRPMGIRGKSKSYYPPRSIMTERWWNKSAQVKNDTLIRIGDNGIEYFDGKKWITIPPVQMPNVTMRDTSDYYLSGDDTIWLNGYREIKIPPSAGSLFKGIDTTKKGFSIYMGTDNIHPNASGIGRMNSMLKEMWDSIEKSISVIDATVDGLPATNLKFMNDTFDYQVHYSIPGVFTFLPLYEYIEASTEAEAKEKFITLFTGRKYSILFIRDATVYNWRVWWEPLDGILEYPVYKDIPSETKSHAKDMFRWNNKDCRMVKVEKMERQKRYYK